YPSRLRGRYHPAPDRLITTQAPKGIPPTPTMFPEPPFEMKTPRLAVRAAIGDMQFPTAMSAAQETSQQCLAATDRAACHQALTIRIVGDQALIPFEFLRREISLVMVCEQDVPLASFTLEATHHALAARLDCHTAAGSAERVGAAVDRIGQDVMDGIVDRQLPDDAAAISDRVVHGRQGDALMTEPQMDLPDALELGEFGKDQRHSFAHPLIRVFHDAVVSHLDIANRYRQEQLSPSCLLPQRFQRTLPQDRELQLAHCTLHAEQY